MPRSYFDETKTAENFIEEALNLVADFEKELRGKEDIEANRVTHYLELIKARLKAPMEQYSAI